MTALESSDKIDRDWETTCERADWAYRARNHIGVSLDDFYAYMPMHTYIYAPSREMWPASSVNARVSPLVDANLRVIRASAWLDRNKPVEQMTWAPGLPMLIRDRLVSEGGWIERKGVTCFNLYLRLRSNPGTRAKLARESSMSAKFSAMMPIT